MAPTNEGLLPPGGPGPEGSSLLEAILRGERPLDADPNGPDAPAAARIAAGHPGPFLLAASPATAAGQAAELAQLLETEAVIVPSETIGLAGDAVGDMTAALRDAVFLRVRLLKKVYEGRLEAVRPLGPPRGPAAARLPPAQLEVVLQSSDDRRTIRLEGGYARAFHTARPALGDIIQIDTERAVVVIRRDREETDGFVGEERDLVYRIRLGDIDRSGVPPEPEEGVRAAPAPAVTWPLLGTGRHVPASLDTMRATDAWAEAQLGGKGTRLEPGVLVLTAAETLPHAALVLLREAAVAPVAPIIVLASEDEAALARWAALFPHAQRLE